MKLIGTIICLLSIAGTTRGADKDSTHFYPLPDSIKAVGFLAEIKLGYTPGRKGIHGGIQTDVVKLYLEADSKEKEIVFEFPKSAKMSVIGIGVNAMEPGELSFDYNWSVDETYKLLIAQATDSADNFSLYSGYVFLPKENKWKLIGSCRIDGRWSTIQSPSAFVSNIPKQKTTGSISQVWIQRNTGSWKNMKEGTLPNPVINWFSHVDSVAQRQKDVARIESAKNAGLIDVRENKESVYYKIINPGTGRQVSANDTVTVFYKVTLMNDNAIIDQTTDKPATFPLKRLIKGWSIGVPLLKVGGKIMLVIPSDLAYTIRTRSPKIPPNSVLVFEIEVLDAKSPQ